MQGELKFVSTTKKEQEQSTEHYTCSTLHQQQIFIINAYTIDAYTQVSDGTYIPQLVSHRQNNAFSSAVVAGFGVPVV